MNEEIEQIERNKTWTLVPRPKDKNVIGTKTKKGYSQEEGIDYGEIFSLIARLEGVTTLLAYVAHKGFKVYQIDVKFAFPSKKNIVFKLHKALYRLNQAPKAWNERLHGYLISIGF